ncbi:MAG: dual specificity protein phosphatase family protein [bacterium]
MLTEKRRHLFLITAFISLWALSLYGAELAIPQNDIPGLPNFAKVSDVLYRGAQPDEQGFKELKKMGVKTIINLRDNHSDTEMMKDLGLQYVSIPVNTWDLEDKDVVMFLQIATNPANQPIFVHCQHGSDRTGTMAAIYRVYEQKWSRDDAIRELPNFGFHRIWHNLKKYIRYIDLEKIRPEVNDAEKPKVELIK